MCSRFRVWILAKKWIKLKLFIDLAVILFLPGLSFSNPLSQTDVSILIPLPQNELQDVLFRPASLGQFGELLPKSVYTKIPAIVLESPDIIYGKLRVVAVRIDPCFPMPLPSTGCQPQVRMIWQPLEVGAKGKVTTLDAAIHTFYDLPLEDFKSLINQLEQLKNSFQIDIQDENLTVNPSLVRFGLNSSYAQKLFSILLSQVGSHRLSQATFMQLSGGDDIWTFGGFSIAGDSIESLVIPRIADFTQTFTNIPSPISPTYFAHGSIFPSPQGEDTFEILVTNSRDLSRKDEREIFEGTMSTFRIENPSNHNPRTMDCVSCHTAQLARVWSTRQYPWLNLDLRGQQFKFSSSFDTTNTSPHQNNTKILHAFGYSGTDPAINQRTINETAKVLEKLYRP